MKPKLIERPAARFVDCGRMGVLAVWSVSANWRKRGKLRSAVLAIHAIGVLSDFSWQDGRKVLMCSRQPVANPEKEFPEIGRSSA